MSNWQWGGIGSGNVSALNGRRAITWTNVYPVPWRIYAALEGDELNDTRKCMGGKVEDNSSSVMMWLSTYSKRNGWMIPSILSQIVNTLKLWTIERERPAITPSISSCENILLAISAGNSPVSGEFLAQRPVTRSFDLFFDLPWING